MKKLEYLPEITDRALDGLRADETLKAKILDAALHEENHLPSGRFLRFIPVLMTSVAVMLLCIFLLNGKAPVLQEEEQHLIHSFSAGSSAASAVSFDAFTETGPESVKSMELLSAGKLSDRDLIVKLMEMLKLHSEPVADADVEMNDQLDIFDSSGLLFSLQAEFPYIRWSDGVRKCEPFFELFLSSTD